jgi:hypothetical protein
LSLNLSPSLPEYLWKVDTITSRAFSRGDAMAAVKTWGRIHKCSLTHPPQQCVEYPTPLPPSRSTWGDCSLGETREVAPLLAVEREVCSGKCMLQASAGPTAQALESLAAGFWASLGPGLNNGIFPSLAHPLPLFSPQEPRPCSFFSLPALGVAAGGLPRGPQLGEKNSCLVPCTQHREGQGEVAEAGMQGECGEAKLSWAGLLHAGQRFIGHYQPEAHRCLHFASCTPVPCATPQTQSYTWLRYQHRQQQHTQAPAFQKL